MQTFMAIGLLFIELIKNKFDFPLVAMLIIYPVLITYWVKDVKYITLRAKSFFNSISMF